MINNATKKAIIILAAAIVVLAAALIILSFVLPGEQPEQKETQKLQYLVDSLRKEDISSVIVYRNGEKSTHIYKNTAIDEFLLEGYEANIYEDNFTTFFAALSNMIIDEQITDPLADSEYGLADDMSAAVIEITKTDGTVHKVYVGDILLSGGAYYCKRDGDDGIYAVRSTIENVIADKKTFISKIVAEPFEESTYYYTDDVKIYKNNQPFLHIELVPEAEREEGDVYALYRMLYPAQYTPNDMNYGNLLKALASPTVDELVSIDVTEEDFAKYGFTNPSFDIEYTPQDGKTRRLIFGNKTADGRIYMISLDYGFIGLVDAAAKYPFVDWELIDYVNNALIGYNIDVIDKITVQASGLDSTYDLEGEAGELAVTNENGDTVDTHNFRQFYRVLLMTSLSDYAEVRSTDNKLLTVTLEMKNGNKKEFAFYGTTTRKSYFTINGEGEFYVSLDDVDNIRKAAAKLNSGEAINADTKYQ